MSSENDQFGKLKIVYSEMTEADQSIVVELALNALKSQDKSDHMVYQKDMAQMLKTELDKSKG